MVRRDGGEVTVVRAPERDVGGQRLPGFSLPEFQRIGRKAFRRVIDGLMRTGNAFFIQKNGKVAKTSWYAWAHAGGTTHGGGATRPTSGSRSVRRIW